MRRIRPPAYCDTKTLSQRSALLAENNATVIVTQRDIGFNVQEVARAYHISCRAGH